MSTISVLPSQIADWLSEQTSLGGIRFITEYPAVKKEIPLKRVTVAVGIGKMEIVDSFTANDEGVLVKNEYCRLANIKVKLAIHVPYSKGGATCHDVLTTIIDCLTFDTDLNVVESAAPASRRTGTPTPSFSTHIYSCRRISAPPTRPVSTSTASSTRPCSAARISATPSSMSPPRTRLCGTRL